MRWLLADDREQQLVGLGADLADRRDIDSRLVHDRALVLADPAADAEHVVDDGRFLGRRRPVEELRFDHDELDRLGRGWAVLLANDARFPQRVRDAAVLLDPDRADLGLCLLLDLQFLDRPGRTDLGAERAVIFAVADLRDQHGRPDPLGPGFRKRRLEPVRRAGLHALAALDALLEERLLGEGSRRTDELQVGSLPGRGYPEERGRDRPERRRRMSFRRERSTVVSFSGFAFAGNVIAAVGQMAAQVSQ